MGTKVDSEIILPQAEALELIRRTADENWLRGMLAQPDGHAIINAATAIASATSRVLADQVSTMTISDAPTGRPGQATLTVTRLTTTSTATIPHGFKFVTSLGVELLLAVDVKVAIGQEEIVLPLQTIRQIDLVETVDAVFDDVLPVGNNLYPITSPDNPPVFDDDGYALLVPSFETSTLFYKSSTPIVDAAMDWLSAHGDERSCRRQPNEEGEAYRNRVRQISDAVSPAAVQQAVRGVKGILPEMYMVEPTRDQSSEAARQALGLLFADAPFAGGGGGYCDDALGEDVVGKGPFRTCTMRGVREGRAYFREALAGPLREPDGLVLYCNAGYCDDAAQGFPDLGGLHPALQAALRAVQDECHEKRAGGVQFDISVETTQILYGRGEGAADSTGVVVLTLEPAADSVWLLKQLLCGVVGIDQATDEFQVRLTLEGGTTLTSPWSAAPTGILARAAGLEKLGYFGQRVTKLEGLVRNSVGNAMSFEVTLWLVAQADFSFEP